MAIESLPGNFLGTVMEFGVTTALFPGIPGLPFDGLDRGIVTTSSVLYYLPGVFFSVAGGGVTVAPAPAPTGGGTGWDGGQR